jgi:hypothetical protein
MVSHCARPTRGVRDRALHEHSRSSSLPAYTASKLACFPSLGRAPMLVYVRPSNEHILIVRVPGAQDQRGCPCHLSSAHRQHHAKSRLAAHHTIVGGSGLFEREGLDHGTNAGQRTEVQRVFRIPGGSGWPALNRPARTDELNGRDSNGVG